MEPVNGPDVFITRALGLIQRRETGEIFTGCCATRERAGAGQECEASSQQDATAASIGYGRYSHLSDRVGPSIRPQ